MGMPAARITDLHVCPALLGAAAPIITGCFTVLTGSMPQARITDVCACSVGTDPIIIGSFTVIVGGKPAARIADPTLLGGVITTGMFTVLIG